MNKDIYYTKSTILDNLYIKPHFAEKIVSLLDLPKYSTIIEPCAGCGNLSKLIPNCVAFDINPTSPEITQKDFFTYSIPRGNILVVGAPPFSRQSRHTVKFFNHAAKFAQTIAFVVEKTFRHPTTVNKLDKFFHLQIDLDMPTNCFTFNGFEYELDCAFQVWERADEMRLPVRREQYSDYVVVVDKDRADVAMFNKGKNIGKATEDVYSVSSGLFLKNISDKTNKELVEFINSLSYPNLSLSRNQSKIIGKEELYTALKKNWR